MNDKKTVLSMRKPRAQHWYYIAVGRSKFNISLTANTQSKRLGCEIYIRGQQAKQAFKLLQNDKEKIESEIGESLNWQELPDGQDCRIVIFTDGDIRNKENWQEYLKWFWEHAEKFHKVFSERIKKLTLVD